MPSYYGLVRQPVKAEMWDKMTGMNRHAGPERAAAAPPGPEPTYAERARTLAYLGRTGT